MRTSAAAEGPRRGVPAAVLAAASLAAILCGCAANSATGPDNIVTRVDAASTAQRFRDHGAREMTLSEFCKSPPQVASAEGTEAIKVSCSGRVLKRAGNARVFDKGSGVYSVVFVSPIRRGDICDTKAPP
ncbi:MAG TPA: hypothetical protein EYQ83_06865, partial [Acidobacteria bacterium]|nr:hypothetical protein [Acidobacteriota bacterium]